MIFYNGNLPELHVILHIHVMGSGAVNIGNGTAIL